MFKALLIALVLLFSSTTSFAKDCPKGLDNKDVFFKDSETSLILTLTPEAQKKFIAYLNPIRTNNGGDALPDNAEFFFTLINVNTNGVVWFADGCELKDTRVLIPAVIVSNALVSAGVTAEDMVEYKHGQGV